MDIDRENSGSGSGETDRSSREPGREAPELEGEPDLQALHRELAEIRIQERSSFGPELERELERRWATRPRRPARPAHRTLALAAGVVLLFTGLSVPPARAALVRLIQATVDLADPEAETLPEVTPIEVVVPRVPDEEESEASPPAVAEDDDAPAADRGIPREEVTVYPVRNVAPEIWDRAAAREVISRFYPEDLAADEIGGVVGLLIYVDSDGRPSQFRVDRSSGIPELDRAALVAAPRLRFLPARRNGEAVGTWVAFDLRFDPHELWPEISGLLVVGAGEEIAPMALPAAMPLPEILPEPPLTGTVGILVRIDDLPRRRDVVEIRVAVERGEGVGGRTAVPFRLQGEEEFRRSRELPVEELADGVLYLTVNLDGLEAGPYDAWVQVHVPGRGDLLERSASITVP